MGVWRQAAVRKSEGKVEHDPCWMTRTRSRSRWDDEHPSQSQGKHLFEERQNLSEYLVIRAGEFCVPPSGVGGRRTTRTNGRRKSIPLTCCTPAPVQVFLSLSRPELRHGRTRLQESKSPGRYHSLWRMRSNASQPDSNHLKQTTEKGFSEIEQSRLRVGPSSRALRRTCG